MLGAQAAAFKSAIAIESSPMLFVRIPSDKLVGPEAGALLAHAEGRRWLSSL